MTEAKPFVISKRLVWEAYQRVKANRGAAGIDGQTITEFDEDRNRNLYRIWNRMSSGSYFPPPVKEVAIPKRSGGERRLGIPTVADRIAQTAVSLVLEPLLEPVFHEDSYGYRPGRSAHDAIAVTRRRCWERDWVLEYDIRGLFDNIGHELLLKALRHHCDISWVLLYVERWLIAPMQTDNGEQRNRSVGTPQGGPLTPPTMLQKRVVSARKRTVSNAEYHVNVFAVNFYALNQRSKDLPAAVPIKLLEPVFDLIAKPI